jgi:3',5'-nucleoside bisphosphate phosphatase
VIDLHLHTTASDGRSTPANLVSAALRARLAIISVTDHDTVAGIDDAAAACAATRLRLVTGIEVTAAREDVEVHVLGYFIDHRHPRLLGFLESQRADRVRRVTAMLARLRDLGAGVNEEDVLAARPDGQTVGRPLIARALVRAGMVRTTREAFDLYLAEGRPAFVPRAAPDPAEVFDLIHEAGGIASLAHPGLLAHDQWIPGMAAAGLDALEAFYIEHSPEITARYRELAAAHGLVESGGSDYHGDVRYGPQRPGDVSLPMAAFERLESVAEQRQGRSRREREREAEAPRCDRG